MRETIYILVALVVTWLAIFFIVPVTGFDINLWKLVLSASVGALFAGILVLHREAVVEDILKVIILLILAGVLWGEMPELGFIFVSALIAGVAGAVFNQVNQCAANRRMQTDQTTHLP